jgi:hypothetical protein
MKVATFFHLLSRLIMNATIPSLPYMPSWYTQEQLYLLLGVSTPYYLTTGIRLHNSDILYKFLQPGNKTMVNLNSNAFLINRVLCMLSSKDYIMTKQSTLAPKTTELK